MEEYVYTLPEAAKLLKVDKNRIYALADKGILKVMKLGCKKVSRFEIERFLIEYAGKNLDDLDNIKDIS